jgi:adenylate cyclase
MEKRQARKLAVILHADVVGSTRLVQENESLAHSRIQDAFRRFSLTIEAYNGVTNELRGDALVAEFTRASDALAAGLAFQIQNTECNARLEDNLQPRLRIGISLGEVVIADSTVTGAGLFLPSGSNSWPSRVVCASPAPFTRPCHNTFLLTTPISGSGR